MKPEIVLFTCHILKFLSVWALVHGIAFTNMAMALTASHALTIRLFPERSELVHGRLSE